MEIAEILKLRQNANGLNKLMNMHVITLDKDGGATVEVELTDELLNPLGMAHGGTIFTLCDIAAGSAAASQGTVAVTPPYTFVICAMALWSAFFFSSSVVGMSSTTFFFRSAFAIKYRPLSGMDVSTYRAFAGEPYSCRLPL